MKKYVLVPYDEVNKTPNTSSHPKLSSDDIIASLPKNIKHKAIAILKHISQNSDYITWNEIGEVSINQNVIANSHIIDLIKCSLYPYKNINPPGLAQFNTALQESNIPQTLLQKGAGLSLVSSVKKPPPGFPLISRVSSTASTASIAGTASSTGNTSSQGNTRVSTKNQNPQGRIWKKI